MEKRPTRVPNITQHIQLAGCGELILIITYKDGKLFEIFTKGGNSGGCFDCMVNGLCVAISLGLRSDADADIYIKGLIGVNCPSVTFAEGIEYKSCIDAVGQAMRTAKLWVETQSENEIENEVVWNQ